MSQEKVPPCGLDLEAALVGVLADDVQLAARDLGGRVDQAVGEALVRPELLDPRVAEPGLQQRVTGAVPGPTVIDGAV